MKRLAIVGAGFSGAVIAHELAKAGFQLDVFDSRNHVAGNCFTERDSETNIMVHVYGPHIFHTSNERVWNYVQQFDEFVPYTNRVKAITQGKVFSLPVNLLTINQFFGTTFSPAEAKAFLASLSDQSYEDPKSFEEQALRFVGQDLYLAFFKHYTIKQWGIAPSELPASILKRLPVRFDYNDNYYASAFQGLPKHGYTFIVERLLDHPNIRLRLGTRFDRAQAPDYDHVFCSGPIDGWFGYSEGQLGYRTLDFRVERHEGDFQGNPVINYCDANVSWTRITEHKHLSPWETNDNTIIYKEHSRMCEIGDVEYYPIRLVKEKSLLSTYVELANAEKNVTFVGRLGTYRYLDMHVAIGEALNAAQVFVEDSRAGVRTSPFLANPLAPS
jgi:UDP-galactopyranose mutase